MRKKKGFFGLLLTAFKMRRHMKNMTAHHNSLESYINKVDHMIEKGPNP